MIDGSARKSRPSHIDIAKYWREREPRFVCDLYEPSCFACGWWKSGGERTWEKCGLERCHIVADSIGGSMDPSNFLLLCPQCHREAPMCAVPDAMILWARTREFYLMRMVRELVEELRRIGVDPDKLDLDGPDKFTAFMRAINVDRHPRSNAPDALVPAMAQAMRMYPNVRKVFAAA